MNTPGSPLVVALRTAAVAQIGIAAVHLGLAHVLALNGGLTRWPADVRELFVVHLLFISLIVLSLSVLTLRFAREMAVRANAICRWLAGAAALFWLLRGWLQLLYSLSARSPLTQFHWILMTVDGGLALVYGLAAWGAAKSK